MRNYRPGSSASIPNANTHGDSDGNLNTYPNNCTETNTYAQAATDSPASAMTLIPK